MADPMNLDAAIEAAARTMYLQPLEDLCEDDRLAACAVADDMVRAAAPLILRALADEIDAADPIGINPLEGRHISRWMRRRADALAPQPERNGDNDD